MSHPTIRPVRAVSADFPFLLNKAKPVPVAERGEHRAYMNHYGAVSVQTPGGLLGVKPAEFEWVFGEPPGWGRPATAERPGVCCWTQPGGGACRTCGMPEYVPAAASAP